MADEAAQDIEALNLRDKDRDDSERRDEVRRRCARFRRRHFFSFTRGGIFRFFLTGHACHGGVFLAITVFVRTNATTTDFGVPFGFFLQIFPTRARSLRTPLLTDGHLKIKNVTPNV